MKKYDAIIIGFGKGGKTLAAELAKRNFTVAMIERSDKPKPPASRAATRAATTQKRGG